MILQPPMRTLADKRSPPASDLSEGVAMELLQQHSLNALVQRALERRILSGELAPGTKLVETDIAAALGASRGPVREAFRTLAQSGLVHTERNRGVHVSELAPEDVNDLYELRAVLDGLVGRLAAKRIGRTQLTRLKRIVREMRVVDRTRDADAYFPLNIEFHEILAEASGNGVLSGSYRRVVNELTLYRRQTLTRNSENIPISTAEHGAIVYALAAADARLAERLLFEHVIASRDRLHRALDMPPPARRKPARAGA